MKVNVPIGIAAVSPECLEDMAIDLRADGYMDHGNGKRSRVLSAEVQGDKILVTLEVTDPDILRKLDIQSPSLSYKVVPQD